MRRLWFAPLAVPFFSAVLACRADNVLDIQTWKTAPPLITNPQGENLTSGPFAQSFTTAPGTVEISEIDFALTGAPGVHTGDTSAYLLSDNHGMPGALVEKLGPVADLVFQPGGQRVFSLGVETYSLPTEPNTRFWVELSGGLSSWVATTDAYYRTEGEFWSDSTGTYGATEGHGAFDLRVFGYVPPPPITPEPASGPLAILGCAAGIAWYGVKRKRSDRSRWLT